MEMQACLYVRNEKGRADGDIKESYTAAAVMPGARGSEGGQIRRENCFQTTKTEVTEEGRRTCRLKSRYQSCSVYASAKAPICRSN